MKKPSSKKRLDLNRETVRTLRSHQLAAAQGAVDQTLHTITRTLLPQPQPPQQPINTLLCPHPQPNTTTIASAVGACS